MKIIPRSRGENKKIRNDRVQQRNSAFQGTSESRGERPEGREIIFSREISRATFDADIQFRANAMYDVLTRVGNSSTVHRFLGQIFSSEIEVERRKEIAWKSFRGRIIADGNSVKTTFDGVVQSLARFDVFRRCNRIHRHLYLTHVSR